MNTDQMKPYYYVYAFHYGGPTVRHAAIAEAQAEAERLAAKHPGRAFEILRCVGIALTRKASTFWMDGEQPPEKPRYRMLDVGETVQLGDEWLNGGKWVPRTVMLGNPVLIHHAPHRRPL